MNQSAIISVIYKRDLLFLFRAYKIILYTYYTGVLIT